MSSVTAIPLLVALIICIVALIVIVLKYRFHCAKRGKPRKFKIDDGDYLINGMYLKACAVLCCLWFRVQVIVGILIQLWYVYVVVL